MMDLQTSEGGNEPEILVPDDEGAGPRSDSLQIPEKRLMLAVLEDAVAILSRPGASRSAAQRLATEEVRRWCASEDRVWPFSFVNICEALGFEPASLRDALLTLRHDPLRSEGRAPIFRARRNLGSRTQVVARWRPPTDRPRRRA